MDKALATLRGIGVGYLGLAAVASALLLYLGWSTPVGYGTFGNGFDAQARFSEMGAASWFLTGITPIVGLFSLGWALATATALPVVLVLMGDAHQWPVTVFLSLVALALVVQRDRPGLAWFLGLGSVLAPASLFLGGTMVVPDGALISMTGSEAWYVVVTMLLFEAPVAAALGAGLVFRRRVLAAEAGRVALARAGQVEEHAAVVAERSRLARDLHDVVAHHVSLIAVRAETAPYSHPGLGGEARAVLADIAADARLALDELRGVLGILGRAGEEPDRSPQPGWADIGALLERARASGAVLVLEGDDPEDERRPVSPAAGYAAYRVVQEALTNARKHAAGLPVTVRLTSTGQVVVVRVGTPLHGQAPASGAGHGLVGMRERVEALGGALRTGPDGDTFLVEATLPSATGGGRG